jgi:hypothetical protein
VFDRVNLDGDGATAAFRVILGETLETRDVGETHDIRDGER